MNVCSQCQMTNEDGAAVCSNCGSELVAGEFTRILDFRGLGRRIERTQNFDIHVPVGTFADQRASEVGASLESFVAAARDYLALDALGRSIVYLAEVLSDPYHPEQSATSGSWIVPARGAIYCIFRSDAPGVDLHKVVLQLVFYRATGFDLAGKPLLWDALAVLCSQNASGQVSSIAVNQAVLAESQGERPPLGRLWQDGEAAPPTQLEWLAALSFLDFLGSKGEPVQRRDFVARAAMEAPEAAARAVYRTSLADLERAWTKAIRKSVPAQLNDVTRFLRSSALYLRPYKLKIAGVFVFLLVQLGYEQAVPVAQRLLIDRAIAQGNFRFLFVLTGVLLALIALVLLTSILNDMLIARVSESVMLTLRERMFKKLQFLSHRFYTAMGTGDILTRFLGDLRAVEQGLTSTLTLGVSMVLRLVLSLVHIMLINYVLGIIVLLTLPIFYLTTRILGPPATRASLSFAEQQTIVTTIVQENLQAQSVIKAFNLQTSAMAKFRIAAVSLYRTAVRFFFLSSLFSVGANLLTSLVVVGVLAIGGYSVIRGTLQTGNLFEFVSLLGLVIGPVQGISGLLQSIQIATTSMNRVEEVLDADSDVQDLPNAMAATPLRHQIAFDHVSFSYRGDQPQLDDVTLEIDSGANVAFVGPSGSGKSTVVNLLLRFYDPDRGRVLLDGVDLREMTVESVRDQIGIVFQDNFLFNTSVLENIRAGRENASGEEVEEAAKLAEMHEAILQMPQGYDTTVGERGGSLSGGQRQRLAIARAVLRSPSILVLDEATSALDARTENAINHTLAGLSRGRTTVAVTHRLAAAQTADRIFVLDRGRLVEQGTHLELIEQNGLYRHLFEEQGGVITGTSGQRVLEVAYLQSVPLFAGLSPQGLQQIATLLQSEPATAGDDIVQAGSVGEKLYLIIGGQLEVRSAGMAGQERLLAVLGPGDYFGEIALVRDVPRTATVRARTDAQLLTLSKETLGVMMEALPGLRRQLEAAVESREAASVALQQGDIGPRKSDVDREQGALEVRSGPDAGHVYPLNETETGLGRNRGNDIVIDDQSASGFHARIRKDPSGAFMLIDSQSTNGTAVNGRVVRTPVPLREGDVIQIGGTHLVFHGNGAGGQPSGQIASVPAAILEVLSGPSAGLLLPLNRALTSFGRNARNAVVLRDELISGFHGRIERLSDGRFLFTDNQSRNGTAVNGRRVAEPVALNPGDTIQMGGVMFRFREAGAAGGQTRSTEIVPGAGPQTPQG